MWPNKLLSIALPLVGFYVLLVGALYALQRPMIFFQGLDDKVVPPQQSESVVEALRARKLPVAYLTLEGEGHGFRKADSVVRTLEAELYFYLRVFGIAVPADLPAIEIENLDA